MEYVLSIIGMPEYSLKRAFAPLGNLVRHIHDHFIPNSRNNYHPHILGHRVLALFSGLLVVLKIFTLTLLTFGPIAPAFSSAINESNVINLTNQSRVQFSEVALTENSELDKAAQAKADDMLAKGYFAHNTPDGKTPWDFIVAAGYSYLEAGENLAVNFTQAEDVQTAWMNSPEHKANILNKNFQEIGIGVSQGQYQGHTAIFVVQEFGTPAAQKITLNDTPTKVQAAAVPAPIAQVAPTIKPAQNQPTSINSVPVKAQTQIRGATSPNQAVVQSQPAPPQPVSIQSGNTTINGSNIEITAQVSGSAVKVLAYFGQQAIMLSPTGQETWSGSAALSDLAKANTTVKLFAFDINRQSTSLQLADFAPNTIDNYNLAGTTPTNYVTILGHTVDPKNMETRFYLLFIAGLLSSMVIAIAMKKHIQHLSLIANSSFVVILAALLMWHG
jgi:uncharacterized protein YkwD